MYRLYYTSSLSCIACIMYHLNRLYHISPVFCIACITYDLCHVLAVLCMTCVIFRLYHVSSCIMYRSCYISPNHVQYTACILCILHNSRSNFKFPNLHSLCKFSVPPFQHSSVTVSIVTCGVSAVGC